MGTLVTFGCSCNALCVVVIKTVMKVRSKIIISCANNRNFYPIRIDGNLKHYRIVYSYQHNPFYLFFRGFVSGPNFINLWYFIYRMHSKQVERWRGTRCGTRIREIAKHYNSNMSSCIKTNHNFKSFKYLYFKNYIYNRTFH